MGSNSLLLTRGRSAGARQGSVIIRQQQGAAEEGAAGEAHTNRKAPQHAATKLLVLYEDIIGDDFWRRYPEVLA